MPVYVIRTRAELVHFYPILRYLYANDEMFNIIKLRHSEAQCIPGSWRIMRKSLSQLYLIFLHPQLATQMRRLLIHLKNSILPSEDKENKENKEQEESESDDEDPRNHPRFLMSCPYCGRSFKHQATRHSRSTNNF